MGRPKGSTIKWQGLIFNNCEILDPVILNKTGCMDKFNIKCYCGKIFQRWPSELKREKQASCGCAKYKISEKASEKRIIDYTNYINEDKTIQLIKPINPNKKCSNDEWVALCLRHDVPIKFIVLPNSVRTNHTKSCGCIVDENRKNGFILYQVNKRIERGLPAHKYIINENILVREMIFKPIRKLIFQIDNFTCQKCNKKQKNTYFNAHHIIPLSNIKFNNKETLSLAFDINNIITLCRQCHKEAHNYAWYSLNKNLQQQYQIIISNRIIEEKILNQYKLIIENKIKPWINNYIKGLDDNSVGENAIPL